MMTMVDKMMASLYGRLCTCVSPRERSNSDTFHVGGLLLVYHTSSSLPRAQPCLIIYVVLRALLSRPTGVDNFQPHASVVKKVLVVPGPWFLGRIHHQRATPGLTANR